MSSNEFINKEEAEQKQKAEEKKTSKRKKRAAKPSNRLFAQIMNGDFLSKDNFIQNLPFTFFIAFLMVVMIGWGYYAETVTKEEVNLTEELDELEAEFFTLNSQHNASIGRPLIALKLKNKGVKESLVSPRKIRVRKYVFK